MTPRFIRRCTTFTHERHRRFRTTSKEQGLSYHTREPGTQRMRSFETVAHATVSPRIRSACAPTGRMHFQRTLIDRSPLTSATKISPRIGLI